MTLSTLSISPCQQGREMFTADAPARKAGSETIVCHNLRRTAGGGALEYAPQPARIATVQGVPVIADRRDEGYYLLRQEDDGSIIVEGLLIPSSGEYTPIGINLGSVEGTVVQAESAGQYVVMLLEDNTLAYIYFDNRLRTYSLLGRLPGFDVVTVTATTLQELTEPVESVTFRKGISDIRPGLDTDAKERIGEVMAEAWERLRDHAAESGVWLQPVNVRLAWRLADGSLLHVSGAQRVDAGGTMAWQCGGRATLLPVFDSDGRAVGTEGGSLSATGYKLSFTPDRVSLGVWDKIVAAVEVWVSEECDPRDSSQAPVCGITNSAHDTPRITAQLVMRPEASLNASLEATPSGVLASLRAGLPIGILSSRREILYNIDAATVASRLLPDRDVRCILGHDGFLHVATPEGLGTSDRGNPFSLRSNTPGDWSNTRAMRVQIWGGGAYTRQIIYVAYGGGVAALAHDSEGRHTNCRTICRHSPRSSLYIARGENTVYMLTEEGSLVSFIDTRARTIATGIEGCSAIFFDRRFGELWLMAEEESRHCVVIGNGLDDVSTRERLRAVPVAGADELLMEVHENGLVDILSTGLFSLTDNGNRPACRWLSETEMPRSDGMWRVARCGIGGEKVDLLLRIGQSDPTPAKAGIPQTLTQMRIKGAPRGLLRFPFRPGATQRGAAAGKGSWRAEIMGQFDAIYHFSVQLPDSTSL